MFKLQVMYRFELISLKFLEHDNTNWELKWLDCNIGTKTWGTLLNFFWQSISIIEMGVIYKIFTDLRYFVELLWQK